MAPLCSDPRQVVIALNPARRQALLKLVDEVTSYMASQLETPDEELGPVSPPTPSNEAPLFTARTDSFDSDFQEQQQQPPQQPPRKSRPQPKPSRQAEDIKRAALKHLADWKREFMPKLEEIVKVRDDAKIQGERKKRQEAMAQKRLETPEEGENLISLGETTVAKSEQVAALQALYHPIPTRLTTIPPEDRREALSCILLVLLSTGKYSAHSRVLALYLASALEITESWLAKEEIEISKSLLESSTSDESKQAAISAEAEAAKRREENKMSRFWKVGLASVAGAAVIGVTGGLAAPVVAGAIGGIMGSVGLGGVASFLGIFWMNGALVGAMFGAYGAKMTGEAMDQYAKEVEDFRFIPLKEEWGRNFKDEDQKAQSERRLRVTIGINGWLNSEDDITRPWRVISDDTEVFALRYEMKTLLALGTALRELVESLAWKALKFEILKRTVLATLLAALWPVQVLAAASNVDNPFSRAHNRSRKAGRLLADALINRVQGERPVTLVGYSLGAAAIHACLQSLAERRAFGLVDTVVLIGTPAPSAPAHWRTLRTVVSGKVFNVYSENDMVLGFVYRAHSLSLGVAGLEAVRGVEGVENLDLSESVSGHLRYPDLTGEILRKCGFLRVKAGAEIEKDDLIKMKEGQVDGDLLQLDEKPQELPKPSLSPSQERLEKDLHGLVITPPALSSPRSAPAQDAKGKQEDDQPEEQTPPLPRRPTAPPSVEDKPVQRKPLPEKAATVPLGKEEGVSKQVPAVKPLNKVESAPASHRPASVASSDEDEGYVGITMVDNDSDED